MAQLVIVHDARLNGAAPAGPNISVVKVNGSTPLGTMIQRINTLSFQFGNEIRLRIMCHGFEDANGRGGFGLQLCQENLTLNTVGQLAPWNGNLSYGITIYSCAAADVAPGKAGIHGDGRKLCSKIASTTGTGVRAADATQIYHHGPITAIDFGRWEGNLLEWNARGTLVGTQSAPQQSRLHG